MNLFKENILGLHFKKPKRKFIVKLRFYAYPLKIGADCIFIFKKVKKHLNLFLENFVI